MITEMKAYRRRKYYQVLGRLLQPNGDKESWEAAALNALHAIAEGGEELEKFLRLMQHKPWLLDDALTALRGMRRYEERQRKYQERLNIRAKRLGHVSNARDLTVHRQSVRGLTDSKGGPRDEA